MHAFIRKASPSTSKKPKFPDVKVSKSFWVHVYSSGNVSTTRLCLLFSPHKPTTDYNAQFVSRAGLRHSLMLKFWRNQASQQFFQACCWNKIIRAIIWTVIPSCQFVTIRWQDFSSKHVSLSEAFAFSFSDATYPSTLNKMSPDQPFYSSLLKGCLYQLLPFQKPNFQRLKCQHLRAILVSSVKVWIPWAWIQPDL